MAGDFMTRLLLLVVIAAGLFGLAACNRQQPIFEVVNSPLPFEAKQYPTETIARHIIVAGAQHNWEIRQIGVGHLKGVLNLRQHVAVVDIFVTADSYSIRYSNESNLKTGDGTIHKQYNAWVRNLDRDIRTHLRVLATRI
jgi:hypothetical protein